MRQPIVTAMMAALLLTAGQPALARGHGHGSDRPAAAQPATPPQKGMVWVNLAKKVYHREGSPHYGKTKNGQWMTEAEAKAKGFHAVGEKPAGNPKADHK